MDKNTLDNDVLVRLGKLSRVIFFCVLIVYSISVFFNSSSLDHFRQQSHKIQCDNGEYLALQGSQPGDFWVISYFMLDNAESESETKMTNLRCNYYEEYKRANDLWLAGKTKESDRANGELYRAYYDDQSTYPVHFKIVPHELKYDWRQFFYAILDAVITFLLGVAIYYIVRFCINFVLYGKKSFR